MKKEILVKIGIAVLNIAVMTAIITGINTLTHQSTSLPVVIAIATAVEVAVNGISFLSKKKKAEVK